MKYLTANSHILINVILTFIIYIKSTDDIITIGPSSADEGGSDADGDNKDEGKKFPWPAVVIPIIVLGVGAGVFAYIKGNKGAENN